MCDPAPAKRFERDALEELDRLIEHCRQQLERLDRLEALVRRQEARAAPAPEGPQGPGRTV